LAVHPGLAGQGREPGVRVDVPRQAPAGGPDDSGVGVGGDPDRRGGPAGPAPPGGGAAGRGRPPPPPAPPPPSPPPPGGPPPTAPSAAARLAGSTPNAAYSTSR